MHGHMCNIQDEVHINNHPKRSMIFRRYVTFCQEPARNFSTLQQVYIYVLKICDLFPFLFHEDCQKIFFQIILKYITIV